MVYTAYTLRLHHVLTRQKIIARLRNVENGLASKHVMSRNKIERKNNEYVSCHVLFEKGHCPVHL